ncbi:hypothetical protein ACFQZ4_17105 [Catellatospora coxensis]
MTTIELKKTPGGPAETPPRRPAWRAGLVIAAALLLAAVLAGHRLIPNVHGIGSVLDTIAPLFGLAVPVLAIAALLARSGKALLVVLLPAVIWAAMFGRALLPPRAGRCSCGWSRRTCTPRIPTRRPRSRRSRRAALI